MFLGASQPQKLPLADGEQEAVSLPEKHFDLEMIRGRSMHKIFI